VNRSTSVRSGLFENLKIEGPVTVTVYGPWGQKTGPDRTSKHYYCVLLHPTSFHLVLLRSTSFYFVLPRSTSFYLVLPRFTSFYLILPRSTSFYLVLPHFTSLHSFYPIYLNIPPQFSHLAHLVGACYVLQLSPASAHHFLEPTARGRFYYFFSLICLYLHLEPFLLFLITSSSTFDLLRLF